MFAHFQSSKAKMIRRYHSSPFDADFLCVADQSKDVISRSDVKKTFIFTFFILMIKLVIDVTTRLFRNWKAYSLALFIVKTIRQKEFGKSDFLDFTVIESRSLNNIIIRSSMSLHDAVFTIRRGSLNLQNNKVMAREGG
jgi:hypothetical protein